MKEIFQLDCEVLASQSYAGDQHIMQLMAPQIAAQAKPGSFLHIRCDRQLPMRRPVSIMLADKTAGTVDILFKIIGAGTKLLADKVVGDVLSVLGPIGQPFVVSKTHKRPILLGGGVGMPPMVFLAKYLRDLNPLLILGSEVPFPFKTVPSQIMLESLPSEVIATMPLMDELGIACRLTSMQDYAGVYQGYVTDLARHYISRLDDRQQSQIALYSCGPHPMLRAVHELALEFNLPCQVSLEEYMACGVGGCAGCVVKVVENGQIAMRRVCVDGPVFDSSAVFS